MLQGMEVGDQVYGTKYCQNLLCQWQAGQTWTTYVPSQQKIAKNTWYIRSFRSWEPTILQDAESMQNDLRINSSAEM